MSKRLDIVILDCSAGMLQTEEGRGENMFHDAKQYISELVQPKLLANKKSDHFGLYVTGLDSSVKLGEEVDENTQVAYEPCEYKASIARLLKQLQPNIDVSYVGLIKAVNHATYRTIQLNKKNKYTTKKITILSSTKFQDPNLVVADQYEFNEMAAKIWDALRNENIQVEFVGVHESEAQLFKSNLVFELVISSNGKVHSYSRATEELIDSKSVNTTTIKKKADTFLCFGLPVAPADEYSELSTEQPNSFRIPVSVFQKKLQYALPPTTTNIKQAAITSGKTTTRRQVNFVTDGKFDHPYPAITQEELNNCLKCPAEKCKKLYNYDGVPIDADQLGLNDAENLNIPVGIHVVGFSDLDSVDQKVVVDANCVVMPRATKDITPLDLLINAMIKHNTVALASSHLPTKSFGFNTQSCYLLPTAPTPTSCGYLTMVVLPFTEEVSTAPLATLSGLPRVIIDRDSKRKLGSFSYDGDFENDSQFDFGMQSFIKRMALHGEPGTVSDFYPHLDFDTVANPLVESVGKACYHRAANRIDASQVEPPLHITSGPTDYHRDLRPIPQDHPFLQEMNELLKSTFL